MKRLQEFTRSHRTFVLAVFIGLACALLIATNIGSAQTQDGRPRRTSMQQGKPATTTPQQTPTPKASPTPKVPTGVVRPGQVILQEAPPDMANPIGAEIGENETVKIDTDLVNLNVRVIDRNNRPIRDVRQDEFHVFENGVEQ